MCVVGAMAAMFAASGIKTPAERARRRSGRWRHRRNAGAIIFITMWLWSHEPAGGVELDDGAFRVLLAAGDGL